MKLFLIIVSISCILSKTCISQNVIVLIDNSLIYYKAPVDNALETEANKNNVRNKIVNKIYARIKAYETKGVCMHIYAISISSKTFYSVMLRRYDSVLRITIPAQKIINGIKNLPSSLFQIRPNNNIYELVSRNNSVIDRELGSQLFATTHIIFFTRETLSDNFISGSSTLTATLLSDNIDTCSYKYQVPAPISETQTEDNSDRSMPVNLYRSEFVLSKNVPSIFSNASAKKPFVIKCDRKTIPNSNKFQLYPVSDPNVQTALTSEAEAKIMSCRIMISDKQLSLVNDNAHQKILDLSLPLSAKSFFAKLKNPLSTGDSLPLFSIINKFFIFDDTTSFQKEWNGKMIMQYNLKDIFYSHAAFIDTVCFKLEVEEPIRLRKGVTIDNVVLGEYANKLGRDKEWTQRDILAKYGTNKKISIGAIILLFFFLIFLIKRYLIDKKRLTFSRF